MSTFVPSISKAHFLFLGEFLLFYNKTGLALNGLKELPHNLGVILLDFRGAESSR
jgi:hypothetical protein